MIDQNILKKIQFLLNLSESNDNLNEVTAAKILAEKLIAKHFVTQEDLDSLNEKAPYTEDDQLFQTIDLVSWKQQLALGIAKHFNCYLIQEYVIPPNMPKIYTYFVKGDPKDTSQVRFCWDICLSKVEAELESKCSNRGPVYSNSYAEGFVESIKNNIIWGILEIPKIAEKVEAVNSKDSEPKSQLATVKFDNKKPIEETTDINSQSYINDIHAYFKGLTDGQDFYFINDLQFE